MLWTCSCQAWDVPVAPALATTCRAQGAVFRSRRVGTTGLGFPYADGFADSLTLPGGICVSSIGIGQLASFKGWAAPAKMTIAMTKMTEIGNVLHQHQSCRRMYNTQPQL